VRPDRGLPPWAQILVLAAVVGVAAVLVALALP
jgi:hypothetical protein